MKADTVALALSALLFAGCVAGAVLTRAPAPALQCAVPHVSVTGTQIRHCARYCKQAGQYRLRRVELSPRGVGRCVCESPLPVDASFRSEMDESASAGTQEQQDE